MNIKNPEVAYHLEELSRALAAANDPQFVQAFLESLLTPAELADIASRWALVKELENGQLSQREIAKKLGLSLCKITRGSRELKKANSPFKRMLELSQTTR